MRLAIEQEDLSSCRDLVGEFARETGIDALDIAAALARMLQGDTPLLLENELPPVKQRGKRGELDGGDRPYAERGAARDRPTRDRPPIDKPLRLQPRPLKDYPDVPMRRYRIAVGHADQVKPGNIVGAIANEGELDSCYIGSVDIYDDFTLVDLPDGMPKEVLNTLRKARVAGKPMNLSAVNEQHLQSGEAPLRRKPRHGDDSAPHSGKPRKKKAKHQKRKGKPAAKGKRKNRRNTLGE